MWPSARCIKLRIGIYLLCTNFLSIERRRRRSRICKHEQRAIRSSKNQIDRIRREIPLSLTTPSLTILWRIVKYVGGRLCWKGLGTGMWLVVFFRFCSRLKKSSFHHGKNETVLILLSPILSSLWLRLWFWFSVFTRSNSDYDSDSNSVASENQPLVGALLSSDQVTWTARNEEACVKWIANGENLRLFQDV